MTKIFSLLAITSELPWPLNTGGHLRSFHILKSLAKHFSVRLVVPVDDLSDPGIAELRNYGIDVRPVKVGARNTMSEAARVLLAVLKNEPYVMYNRHNRSKLRDSVKAELDSGNTDIIYLDHVDPFALRSLFPQAKIIVDLHNVYSKLTARVAEEHSGLRRWYLQREAKLLGRVERQIAVQSTTLMAVSDEEVAEFSALGGKNVHLVPNGVDCSAYSHLPVGRQGKGPVLLYIGVMSWQPNAKAADFLAREVLPAVHRQHPDAVLKLVGRNPGTDVLDLGNLPGVEVHANVPDIGVYLAEASVLAVALDSGGGTRLKILEAFAAGLPVVSTPVGCEGIDCQHGRELWIADRPEFAAVVSEALSSPETGALYAANGRQLVMEKYDWAAIGLRASNAVESALSTHTVQL